MTFCSNCGFQLQDDALFCPECGTKNEITPVSETSTTNTHLIADDKPPVVENISVPPVMPATVTPPPPKQYCRNCGKEVAAGAFACMGCGLPPLKAYNFCPNCGTNCHSEAIVCIKCGVNLESQSSSPSSTATKEKPKAFCRNCGKEVAAGAYACLNCGLPPGKSKNFCPSCGSETHNDAVICIKCGAGLEQFTNSQMTLATPQIIQHKPATPQKTTPNQTNNIVIMGSQKSTGTAFILTFLFGPLGLLYATTAGGIIMIFVSIIVGALTFGLGLIFTQIVCIIWAVVAVNNANQAALSKGAGLINNNYQQ